jgi:hypothetical protein
MMKLYPFLKNKYFRKGNHVNEHVRMDEQKKERQKITSFLFILT